MNSLPNDHEPTTAGPARPRAYRHRRDVGRAAAHLEQLREHLLSVGLRGEAHSVSTALDMLAPSRGRSPLS